MTDTYKITDLYIAAFLKALGYSCDTEVVNKRCHFIFSTEAREVVTDMMRNSDTTRHTVNASCLINEIKSLKAFVNNNPV